MNRSRARRAWRVASVGIVVGLVSGLLGVVPWVQSTTPRAQAAYSGDGFTLMPSLSANAKAFPQYVIKLTDATLAGKRAYFVQAARHINNSTSMRVRVAPGYDADAALTEAQGVIVVRSVAGMLNPRTGGAIDGWSGHDAASATDQVVRSGQFMQLDTEVWSKSVAYQHALVSHELGHALGLDHDPDPASLMHQHVDSSDGPTVAGGTAFKAGDFRGLRYLSRGLKSCADVRILSVRGSGQGNDAEGGEWGPDPGHGPEVGKTILDLKGRLTAGNSMVVQEEGINYPAIPVPLSVQLPPAYFLSVGAGELSLRSRLEDLVTVCPKTKTLLLGHSQGAHVIGNVLEGPVAGYEDRPALAAPAARNIAGVALFGDPTYRGEEAFAMGSAAGVKTCTTGPNMPPKQCYRAGAFARSLGTLSAHNARLRSWCVDGDIFCSFGVVDPVTAGELHGNYYQDSRGEPYRTAAAVFLDGRAGAEPISVPLQPTRPTTFTAESTSELSRSGEDLNLEVCDPGRKGQRVYVQVTRAGGWFAYVDQKLSTTTGCATFANLDGAGPPMATQYTSRVAINQYPPRTWPATECNAATGGQGLCDTTGGTFSSTSTSRPEWTPDQINHRVCDSARVGSTVHLQLSRPGLVFPVVRKQIPASGCVSFADLDGAGPVNPNTNYAIRAGLGRDPDLSWPAAGCYAATDGQGLCDLVTTTPFSAYAHSSVARTANEINYTVCDKSRVGHLVQVELSRPGMTFPVVSKRIPSTGEPCAVFTDLDGAGPVVADATYVLRAGLGQPPSQSWPTSGCHAATGGRGMCDTSPPFKAGANTFQLPFRCGETWTASNYGGHGYGNLDFNRAGDDGAPVLASASGTVYLYRWQPSGGGHVLWIRHPNGWFTVYAHLKYQPTVAVGSAVNQGQVIGYVGSTGGSSGPHLHYEQQDQLDHAVRPSFNGVASPVHNEGDPARSLTSANSC